MPVAAIAVRFESAGALLEVFEQERVTAVYVPESLGRALSSIQQVTRARGRPSLSPGRRMVDSGLSMGVFLSGGSPRLVVNLRSAQVEGLDLSAEVLALAEIVR